jgi:hypothetical protein
MSFGESSSARPIGVPSGPREDYKPDLLVYRRGAPSPFDAATSKGTLMPVMATSSSAGPAVPPASSAPCTPARKPVKPRLFLDGSDVDRVFSAINAGHHITTDIVTATRIGRDAVIKTISYLVSRTRIRALPAFPGMPEKDRHVVPVDYGVTASPAAIVAARDAVERVETGKDTAPVTADDLEACPEVSPETFVAVPAEDPIVETVNESVAPPAPTVAATVPRAPRVPEFAQKAPEAPKPEDHGKLGFFALSACQTIVQEWAEVSVEIAEVEAKTMAVQKRLDRMASSLPDIREAMAAAEAAQKAQATLNRALSLIKTWQDREEVEDAQQL